MLSLPHRHLSFDAINERATGEKRRVTVSRARSANYCHLSHLERPNAVKRGKLNAWDLLSDALRDALHLFDRHGLVRLILQQGDRLSVIVVSNNTDERRDRSRFLPRNGVDTFIQPDRAGADFKQRHAVKSPERPPDLRRTRVLPITMPRSTDLSMS